MKISLDYDMTFTADKEFWTNFIELVKGFDHEVRIVTVRHPEHDKITDDIDIPIIYTNGVAKKFFCMHYADWEPDIWIDDHPELVSHNSEKSKDWLMEWRANRNE